MLVERKFHVQYNVANYNENNKIQIKQNRINAERIG